MSDRRRKLTLEQVKAIRQLKGKKSYRQIAQQFKISIGQAWNIMAGISWK